MRLIAFSLVKFTDEQQPTRNTKQKVLFRKIAVIEKKQCCRLYGPRCGGCLEGISPSDLVRKARDKVFHLKCFMCHICRKQLSTGEELYILDKDKFLCKEDYFNLKNNQGMAHG